MMDLHRRKWIRLALPLAFLLLAGGLALKFLPHRHAAHETAKGGEVYYCPMHPTMTSDRPGDCPICSMKMVKREFAPASAHEAHGKMAEEAASMEGYAPVRITPQKQQIIGVRTAAVTRRKMTKTIRTVGRIAYDPELYQAEQEYLRAVVGLKGAERLETPDVPEQARELVEAARTRLRILGLGDAFIKEMAQWEGPDKSLLLADPQGQVWLYAPIYEFELSHVKVGQEIVAEAQAIPGKTLKGIVRSVDLVLDPMTRTARVRAVLVDPEKVLKPEMYVNASIVVDLGEVLSIPAEAVLDTGVRKIAFVDKGEGLLEPREITVGIKADGAYELREGVAEGELVVINGNFLIDSESRLKAALQGMGSQGQGGEHRHGPTTSRSVSTGRSAQWSASGQRPEATHHG